MIGRNIGKGENTFIMAIWAGVSSKTTPYFYAVYCRE